MTDDDRLTRWRSWLDKGAIPEGWTRNLWDEFFALMHRREMWRGYRELLEASPKDAQESARYLTQWIVRNHVETQAIAVRRIADRSKHPKVVALGRLLDEVAVAPQALGVDPEEAKADADRLAADSERVTTFATKVIAHLDQDHAAASEDLKMMNLDQVVDDIAEIWARWYTRVTGAGVEIMAPLTSGWADVLRLRRRDLVYGLGGNYDYLGARVVQILGVPAARNLLDVPQRSPEERARLIGQTWGRSETRALAEAPMEIEEDPDDLARLRLIEGLGRALVILGGR